MATSQQVIAGLAPVTGIHRATFARYVRDLMLAGIARTGVRGGSPATRTHWDQREIAALLLCLAAGQPGNAAETAQVLGGLVSPRRPDINLWHLLAHAIESAANVIAAGADPEVPEGWELTLRVSPPGARATWADGSAEDYAIPQPDLLSQAPRLPGLLRLVKIDKSVLLAAARLYADTVRHVASLSGHAGPETKSAGTLPQAPAPITQDRDYDPTQNDRANGQTLSTPTVSDYTRLPAHAQALREGLGVHESLSWSFSIPINRDGHEQRFNPYRPALAGTI